MEWFFMKRNSGDLVGERHYDFLNVPRNVFRVQTKQRRSDDIVRNDHVIIQTAQVFITLGVLIRLDFVIDGVSLSQKE